MSLHLQTPEPVPEETARVAHAAFPRGTLSMRVRDVLGTVYRDENFTDLYPAGGHPAEHPWRLALVTVREVDGLERVGETLRQALNALAQVAPEWLQAHLDGAWAERYCRTFYACRLPRGEAAVATFAEQISPDGMTLLDANRLDGPAWLTQLPAVETLGQIWL